MLIKKKKSEAVYLMGNVYLTIFCMVQGRHASANHEEASILLMVKVLP